MRAVPQDKHLSAVLSTLFGPASANAPALQDTLRAQQGPLNIASKLNGRHPLELRLQQWEETQHSTRMETYRRVFGAGEPMRRTMELALVDSDYTPAAVGGGDKMHRDILLNRETDVDWEDVYRGGLESGVVEDMHSEMERRMGI